jgi:O-antigen/teichoic acid export membrane protein
VPRSPEARLRATFAALGAGEVLARLLAFGATIYLARRLGTAEFGLISLATAILLYAACVADAGLDAIGVRDLAGGRADARTLIPPLVVMRLGAALVVSGLIAAIATAVLTSREALLVTLYAVTLWVVGVNTRWVAIGLGDGVGASLARVAGEATMVALVVLLVRGPGDVALVPLAQLVGNGLAALILARRAQRTLGSLLIRADWRLSRGVAADAAPLVVNSLLSLVLFNADLLLLRAFRGLEEVGLYGAAYALIAFLANLGGAHQQSALAGLSALADPVARQRLAGRAAVEALSLGAPLAVGGMVVAGSVIDTVFGGRYQAAALPLAILLGSIPPQFLRNLPQAALIAAGRQRSVLGITAATAVLNLALNLVLIPRFGMVGAASATVASEVVRSSASFLVAQRFGLLRGTALRPAVKAAAAALLMGAALWAAGVRSVWAGVPLGAGIYVAVVLALGLRRDLRRSPTL